MRCITLITASLIAMLSSIPMLRGEELVTADAAKPEISIGELRIQTIPAMSYLCTSTETTFAKMGEPVKAGFDRVFRAVADDKLLIARPTMLVYQDNPHFRPHELFKMEIGVIVASDAKIRATDNLKIRKTEPFKCATILYTGPLDGQGQAYQKLLPAMATAGLRPNGEEREMCLYWEGAKSSSNVFMMMVGID